VTLKLFKLVRSFSVLLYLVYSCPIKRAANFENRLRETTAIASDYIIESIVDAI